MMRPSTYLPSIIRFLKYLSQFENMCSNDFGYKIIQIVSAYHKKYSTYIYFTLHRILENKHGNLRLSKAKATDALYRVVERCHHLAIAVVGPGHGCAQSFQTEDSGDRRRWTRRPGRGIGLVERPETIDRSERHQQQHKRQQ